MPAPVSCPSRHLKFDLEPTMNDDRRILEKALDFHGHRCWASVAGVRAGLAALRELGVRRSGGRQLHAFVEIGEDHGGMRFADGVQYATGCLLPGSRRAASRRGQPRRRGR
jgi:formylmethanofuran dehydrogenase subunit E